MELKNDPLSEITAFLPTWITGGLAEQKADIRSSAEEVRLRRNQRPTVLYRGNELPLSNQVIQETDLREVLERASHASAHTVLEQVRHGFVTVKGGHRIGLGGTVHYQDGVVTTLRYLSSLSIRIARAFEGQADKVLPELLEHGKFQNTLIIGAPGAGKTTLLRALIQKLSDGDGISPNRVGIVDERGEIAALWRGEPQFSIGRQTDVIDGCPKAEGMMILIRGMSPQVLAVDEITKASDVSAMIDAVGCGVSLLATAHGETIADLSRRPVYRMLMSESVFRKVVFLTSMGGERRTKVEVLP